MANKHRLIITFDRPLEWNECFEMVEEVRKLDKGAGYRITAYEVAP